MHSIFTKTLEQGSITVTPDSPKGQYALDDLFDIAQRRNPKRPFLFVSKVLGKHIPVKPSIMRAVYAKLAADIPRDLPQPILVIGMAETAVGLGAGVFEETAKQYPQMVYLTSTRHPVHGDLLCEFTEDHSHATDHLIYLPAEKKMRELALNARSIILVDDEATTGNTFRNLLKSISESGKVPQLEKVVTVTLTNWSGNSLTDSVTLPLQAVSLVSGTWKWQSNPSATAIEMPHVNVTASGNATISGQQTWGRLGMTAPNDCLAPHICASKNEKVLVVGTGEFVYEPFLLAERLEKNGAEVYFSSTSRSPISVGHAIESAICFTDNYGLGIPNFLYNVEHQRFDRIFVCSETGTGDTDKALIECLSRSATTVEQIIHE